MIIYIIGVRKKNMIIYKLNLVLVYLRINSEMQEENDEKTYQKNH